MPTDETAQNTHRQYSRQGHQQNAGLRLPPWDPPVNPIHPFFGAGRPDDPPLPEYKPQRRITTDVRNKIILAVCRNKMSRRAAAEKYGFSRATVDRVLEGFIGQHPIPWYKIRRIYRLRNEDGMSVAQISKRIGISRSTVDKYLMIDKNAFDAKTP